MFHVKLLEEELLPRHTNGPRVLAGRWRHFYEHLVGRAMTYSATSIKAQFTKFPTIPP